MKTIWKKCMDHINNGLYQLHINPTTKIKVKTLKLLKALKDSKFIDNKLYYYLKLTDPHAPRFYGQPKLHKPGVPICPIVSSSGSPLYNLNKYIAIMPRILPHFPTTTEMFPLKMMRQWYHLMLLLCIKTFQ